MRAHKGDVMSEWSQVEGRGGGGAGDRLGSRKMEEEDERESRYLPWSFFTNCYTPLYTLSPETTPFSFRGVFKIGGWTRRNEGPCDKEDGSVPRWKEGPLQDQPICVLYGVGYSYML